MRAGQPRPAGGAAPGRYGTLDALRGTAALVVVVYHLHVMGWPFDLAPHGYLAVDFFFALSGFVMALRYGGPLRGGMAFRALAARRLARIGPLALAGALLGSSVWLGIWAARPDYTDGLPALLRAFALNLFLLPDFWSGPVANRALFPENGALWSLCFELLVNLLWAGVGVRLGTRALVGVLAVSGALLGACVLLEGTANLGWGVENAGAGLLRALFGFTAGLLIHRVHLSVPLPRGRAAPLVLALLLVALVAAPLDAPPAAVPWWDLAAVLAALPALVLLGTGQAGGDGPVAGALGRISYPLYALHGPVLMGTQLASGFGARGGPALTAAGGAAASVAAAWLALRFYDDPVQAWLKRRPRRAEAARRLTAASRARR